MNEYIEHNRQNNMFFDENTDDELVKFKAKLERKKIECAECEKRLEKLVERRNDYGNKNDKSAFQYRNGKENNEQRSRR